MTITVIVGMHRSGTSALANLLTHMGLTAGENLLPANEHNPEGHFEDTEVLAINEAVLRRLGTVWHLPFLATQLHKALDCGDLDAELKSASALLRDRASRYRNWLVKEPRLSVLMPFWQRALSELNIPARYVWMIRHPAEVAASLTARDQLGLMHTSQTWVSYQFGILSALQGQRAYLLNYATLLSSNGPWLESLARFLGIDSSAETLGRALSDSVTRTLYNQRIPTAESAGLPDQLYAELGNYQPGPLASSQLSALWARWSSAAELLPGAWEWARDLHFSSHMLQEQYQELSQRYAHLARNNDQNLAELERLSIEHERLVAEHERLVAEHERLVAEHERLVAEQLIARGLIASLEQSISDREHRLSLMLNSYSWRLTRPLRWLKKQFVPR